jgi:hypothetical protein
MLEHSVFGKLAADAVVLETLRHSCFTKSKFPVTLSAQRLVTPTDVFNGLRHSLLAITAGSTFRKATSGSLYSISQYVIHGSSYARCAVEKVLRTCQSISHRG